MSSVENQYNKNNKNNKKTVFVAISGGVDSSVAAFLLKKQGYNVIGVFMRCYNLDGCGDQDAEDARRVAEKLKIPFYVWDFEIEYKKKVVEYMIKGYKRGITPNPDVMCNKEIKFGLFLNKALKMRADYVATGHYVKNKKFIRQLADKNQNDNAKSRIVYKLHQAKDSNKDQSYFLWTLTQKQLKYCLFPIGDYLKSETRKIAKKAGLPTAEKKDSQGICFLGKVNLKDFLKKYIPEKKGSILLKITNYKSQITKKLEYKKIGEHKGAHFYTIGQRYGLGIGGSKNPYYIVKKDVKKNIIVVAEGENNQTLYKKEIKISDVNFISQNFHSLIRTNNKIIKQSGRIIEQGINVLVRVRYRQPLAKARLLLIKNSKLRIQNYKIVFDEPQKFIASGQSAVIYNKNGQMIGGGIII